MKNKHLSIKSLHSMLLVMIALLMNVTLSFAQNDMTKIKDGTISNSKVQAELFSILELESNSKGFLLPRMTTAERNALTNKINDKVRGNGLAIYNTDNDCINYWSTLSNKWLSVCGTLPPAKMEMDCSKIFLNASDDKQLKQGQSLRDTDLLYVTVNVVESGSYSISAVTKNGYSFSKSGVFETTGTYSIALEGFGTPLQENEAPNGDAVLFKINGKENTTCTSFKIPVKSSALEFNIIEPQNIAVTWSAYKGVPLNATDNIVKVKVNVKTPGFWRIQSDKVDNGISFSGSGEFKEGDEGEQTITIYGQGTPIDVKDSTFKLVTNSKGNKTSNVTVTVKVVPTSFALVCESEKIEIRGEFKEDTKLNKSNSVLLPVKVLAPGIINIELNGTIKGATDTPIKFVAPNTVLSFNGTDNIQYVTLYAEKDVIVPVKATEIVFTSMTPSTVSLCADFPKIKVVERNKNYSFDCSKSTLLINGSAQGSNNYFLVGVPLVAGKHSLSVVVNVGYAEKYTIKTNELNGVRFEKTGVFTDQERAKGIATVILDPIGMFSSAGYYTYSLYTEGLDPNLSNQCSIIAQVRGREINVLSFGAATYAPKPSSNQYAPGAILTSAKNFGPNGKVVTGKINITWQHSLPKNLSAVINSSNIDIIIIGYHARYDEAQKNVLVDFVKNKKGALIVADETNFSGSATSIQLVRDLGDGSTPTASNKIGEVFSLVNPVIGPANDPIVKSDEFGSIAGGLLGNDVRANGWYFQNLSKEYIPIAVSQINSKGVFAFRHNTLGFVFIGDGGAFAGKVGNTSDHIWPAAILADGTPIAYTKYDGGTVSNSIFYANSLKWAIDYVTKNKPFN